MVNLYERGKNASMKNQRLVKKVMTDMDIRDSIYQLLTMNPFAIQAIKGNYVDDEMWMYAIDLEPTVFQFIESYKKIPSTKLCMYAVRADGSNIRYIHPSRITEHMMDVAHRTCPTAHLYVKHNHDKEGVTREKTLVPERSSYQESMEEKMTNTILSQLRKNPSMIREIKDPTDEMKAVALVANPDVLLYFDELSPFMVQLMDEYYPDIASMYPNYIAYKRKQEEY